MNELSELSPVVLAGVGGLVLVQLGLQVAALVSLVRTPGERLTLGGRKWAWALIIVLGEIIGAILYFVAARKPALVAEKPHSAATADRARSAADALYGPATTPEQADDSARNGDADERDAGVGADGTGMGELP